MRHKLNFIILEILEMKCMQIKFYPFFLVMHGNLYVCETMINDLHINYQT